MNLGCSPIAHHLVLQQSVVQTGLLTRIRDKTKQYSEIRFLVSVST